MPKPSDPPEYLVGVDLGPNQILAGVFDGSLRFLRKAKFSTKAERGPDAVLDRIARCVCDAVDESDLGLDHVRAVGLGTVGEVDAEQGAVRAAPELGWQNVPLRTELERRLGRPVAVETTGNAVALGVYGREFHSRSKSLVAILLGAETQGGWILHGEPSRDFDLRGVRLSLPNGTRFAASDLLGEAFISLRLKEIRNAFRRGEPSAEKLLLEAGQRTGLMLAHVIEQCEPELVALAGAVMEDLRNELLPIVLETVSDSARSDAARRVSIVASDLGSKATMTGGAVLARQHSASHQRGPRWSSSFSLSPTDKLKLELQR